jgi:hypothetical protein
MREVVERVEDAVAAAAEIRRRAHPVEDQPEVTAVAVGGVVAMTRGVEPLVRQAAPIELGEERPEPLGVLVVDADRTCAGCHDRPLKRERPGRLKPPGRNWRRRECVRDGYLGTTPEDAARLMEAGAPQQQHAQIAIVATRV